MQRYANPYVDRKLGQPIIIFRPNTLIGQSFFFGPTPSTDDIKTYKIDLDRLTLINTTDMQTNF